VVRRSRSERGYALLTALVILLLVSISLALLAAALQVRMRLIRQEAEILQLGALSDAALAEALYNLTYDQNFSGKDEHDFGSGKIASEVERITAERYRVRATAIYAGNERTVEAEVVRTYRGARVVRWRRDPGR
jgi:type II secretory pathway component PulK